ncbi:MAG: hypothetical protein PHP21_05040 [Patescibacteria group bacterium]|nr:hypothetical protein [Patescibacteria group bacterium]
MVCPKCGKENRVGFKYLELTVGGEKKRKKIRICKKCQQEID